MSETQRRSSPRPSKKPKKLAMRLASFSSIPRREMSDYLLLERPPGRVWTSTRLKQRMESRPPLQADLEGPTPCTYTLTLPKPAVHGTKINPIAKYDRGLLPGDNTQLWTQNLSIAGKNPDPFSYDCQNIFGRKCPIMKNAPSFSMTPRRMTSAPGVGTGPGPQSYDYTRAMKHTFVHYPSFTIATRKPASKSVPTPGPAHYYPVHTLTKHQSPAFSMQPRRHSRTYTQ